MTTTNLAWLRNDLRAADNPALCAASADGAQVTALYIHEETADIRPPGGAARWWLHRSLVALETRLAGLGVALIVRGGDPRVIVADVAAEI
ncbi:MAG: deoxyribodipyrimidine photo-lyase, partial [Alphaproteobacteria bacterium]|nr:deoxyribodipyrimidine photo-lyase [Alphaproteobacteria bacterium]